MNLDDVRNLCLHFPGRITEEFPFGDDVLVFKTEGKMFLLARLTDHPSTINLKCDPERAVELRERFAAVTPGYHMNKRHWNTVLLDGSIPPSEIRTMIEDSFHLVCPFPAAGKTAGKSARRSPKRPSARRPKRAGKRSR